MFIKVTFTAVILLTLIVSPFVAFFQTGGQYTNVIKGASLPGTCNPGGIFYLTSGTAGYYRCIAANTWAIDTNVIRASEQSGSDFGAKVATALGLLPSTGGIIDATGFTGTQTVSTDFFNTTKCVILLLPATQINWTAQTNYATCTGWSVATPSAPALTGSGTGGTFTNASNTTLFVKVTYALDGDSNRQTVASGETSIVLNSNGCTAGLTTCSVTVTTPAAATAAGCYNVYASTVTGTEKLVNALCVPVGVNYVITANGAGVSPPSSTTAYYGYSAMIGAGRGGTILHMTSAGFITSGCCRVNNFLIRDMSIVGDVGNGGQAKIVCFGCDNVEINNVEFSGGGQSIFWDGPTNSRLLHTKHTTLQDGAGYININADDFPCNHVLIDDVTMNGGRPPTGSNAYAFAVNNCDNVQVSNVEADNIDGSQRTSYAAIALSGVRNCSVSNILSHDNIAADGFAMLGNSQTGAAARNTAHCSVGVVTSYNNGKVAGSPNNGNGDGVDLQDVDDVAIDILNLRANGLTVGVPNFECYYCTNVTVGTLNANGGKGGATIVSGQNVSINGGVVSSNQGPGITHTSNTTVMSTVGTAVTWVSGGLFSNGWVNMPVVINVSGTTPTLFKVCSVTDFKHMTLCSGPANQTSQNMFVDTQGLYLSNLVVNSNGQSPAGAGDINRAGIYLASMGNALAPTTFKLAGITASDPQTSPTQTVGVSIQNNSVGSISNFNSSGNVGSSICSNVPDVCDSVGITSFDVPGVDAVRMNSGLKVVTADFVTAANTNLQTITGLVFTLPPNIARRYSIDCHLIYAQQTAGVANSGFGWQVATVAPTNSWAIGTMFTSATTPVQGVTATLTTTTATNIVTATPTVTTNWLAELHILVNNPSNASANTVNVMVKTGTSADTMTVRKDSWCSMATVK